MITFINAEEKNTISSFANKINAKNTDTSSEFYLQLETELRAKADAARTKEQGLYSHLNVTSFSEFESKINEAAVNYNTLLGKWNTVTKVDKEGNVIINNGHEVSINETAEAISRTAKSLTTEEEKQIEQVIFTCAEENTDTLVKSLVDIANDKTVNDGSIHINDKKIKGSITIKPGKNKNSVVISGLSAFPGLAQKFANMQYSKKTEATGRQVKKTIDPNVLRRAVMKIIEQNMEDASINSEIKERMKSQLQSLINPSQSEGSSEIAINQSLAAIKGALGELYWNAVFGAVFGQENVHPAGTVLNEFGKELATDIYMQFANDGALYGFQVKNYHQLSDYSVPLTGRIMLLRNFLQNISNMYPDIYTSVSLYFEAGMGYIHNEKYSVPKALKWYNTVYRRDLINDVVNTLAQKCVGMLLSTEYGTITNITTNKLISGIGNDFYLINQSIIPASSIYDSIANAVQNSSKDQMIILDNVHLTNLRKDLPDKLDKSYYKRNQDSYTLMSHDYKHSITYNLIFNLYKEVEQGIATAQPAT